MRHSLLALSLAFVAACSSPVDPAKPGPAPAGLAAASGGLKISGPFVHEHLALYVIEDPNAKPAQELLTLAEGLSSGTVKVSEKKSAQVNELMIENGSDKPCFVQAGDVVKGGQQDRLIGRDFVIPPKTAPTAVSSFCVEQSRWHGAGKFEASTQNAYGKDLKLAVQKERSQQKVWEDVAKSKSELRAYNSALELSRSSSLNEELEDPKIKERLKASRDAMGKIVEDRPQAVGLIWAINGKFSTADLYDDPSLFRRIYPRLLDSATMEALTVKPDTKPAPAAADASKFLADAEKGQTKKEEIRQELLLETCENEKSVQFDYEWAKRRVHRQVVNKQ
jgi:hypothetical protein